MLYPQFCSLKYKHGDQCILHFQWEYAWLSVSHIISQQRCEIEQWFQRTTYRKLHIRSPVITWLMTSHYLKRSMSWTQNLSSSISQQLCEIDGRFILTTNRKRHLASPMITWLMMSRDSERSRSWLQYLWSLISQKPCEIDGRFK